MSNPTRVEALERAAAPTHQPGRQPQARQRAILHFIQRFTDQNGFSPSIREIGEAAAIPSTSVVKYHLQRLARQGYISQRPGISRSIRLLQAGYHRLGVTPPENLDQETLGLWSENQRLQEQYEQLQERYERLKLRLITLKARPQSA